MRTVTFKTLCLLSFVSFTEVAVACPDGYYEACFIGCVCLPNSGEIIRSPGPVITEPAIHAAALPLQQWIEQSRNSARSSSMAVPPTIRNFLSRHFSSIDLDRARFKVGDNGILNAAANIMNLNGDVQAVTLDDTIIFRSFQNSNDPILWAHEMVHVRQFRQWGRRDFSIRYTRDSGAIEREAYDFENVARNDWPRFISQMSRQPAPPWQAPSAYGHQTPIPVRFCRTPVFICNLPPALVPMGTPCFCLDAYGRQISGSAF